MNTYPLHRRELTPEEIAALPVTYDFPLRSGMFVRIVVPRNLTTDEAERIAVFVHALAFPTETVAKID